jgi:putative cardiolipin synthase
MNDVQPKRRKRLAIAGLLLVVGVFILDRCNRLPTIGHRTSSAAMTDTGSTRLGKAVAPLLGAHPDLSGIHILRDARNAFAARYRLASVAERTLDVQYYIWRNDQSGTLLMKALVDAADRGVRVRLLLDDNNTSDLDTLLAAIDEHQRIEVRLFNPFAIRRPRAIGHLTEFPRLNRRMHNKSFTADNQVTIIGGRNVGDEYFGATDGVLFADLDVIAIGPVVSAVSNDFDRYWASDSSYPADRLLPAVDSATIAEISAARQRVERDAASVAYMEALRKSVFVRELVAGALSFEWAVTRLISDPPAKALGRASQDDLLMQKFRTIFGLPASEIDLVSPYFVPGDAGVELFRGWAKHGVRVRVLTNSLEATDVAVVHSGYAKRREELLEGGVWLYELRAKGGRRAGPSGGPFGSSASSLHAKTFAVDRSRIFIGSFNFDPRSVELNTEMGFVIDSPVLARRIAATFDDQVPLNAWRVQLSTAGDLVWEERSEGRTIRHRTEPGTGFWQRLGVSIVSAFPIDPLL